MSNAVTKIGIGSKAWTSKLRKDAKEMAKAADRVSFDLGVILWRVFDTPIDNNPDKAPIYTLWGYSSFSAYAGEELGLNPRKAERLRTIGKVLDVDLRDHPKELRERFIALGWSKAREISRLLRHVCDVETAETWITYAEENTYPQTLHTVTKALLELDFDAEGNVIHATESGSEGSEDSEEMPSVDLPEVTRHKNFAFSLLDEQIDTVRDALKRAEELAKARAKNPHGHYKRSNLLSLICLDFLATNEFGKPNDRQTKRAFARRFEMFTGMRVVAFDMEGDLDILHGSKNLEELAERLGELADEGE